MQRWLIRHHESESMPTQTAKAHNLMNFSDYPPLIILILLIHEQFQQQIDFIDSGLSQCKALN